MNLGQETNDSSFRVCVLIEDSTWKDSMDGLI
jgi:hypothetical protein